MRLLLMIGLVTACGSHVVRPAPVPAGTANSELSPALAPLAWWLGDWQAEAGGDGSEHWVAAAGAIYGIALHDDGGFEVMVVDDGEAPGPPDGVLRLIAMPGGARAVEFRERDLAGTSVTFANEAHDDPKSITYAREGDQLRARLGEAGAEFRFARTTTPPAPELAAADLAFSDATGAEGIEGWVAAFAEHGAMMRRGERIEGAEPIRAAMTKLLASGKLAWAPLASARRGDVGFTVGKATFTGTDPTDTWRSTYVSIWQHQPDGAWKVWFDTGRVVQD